MKRNRGVTFTLLILAAFLLLAGCATMESFVSVYAKHYRWIPYVPTEPASVEILRSEPMHPNVRLGEIVLEPQGAPPVVEMEQKLKEAAAEMGANAAVIVADATMRMGSINVGPQWKREIDPFGRETIAVAIRYVQ